MNKSEILRISLLAILLAVLIAPALAETTKTFTYSDNSKQDWNKPDKGIVNQTIEAEIDGPGGGASAEQNGGYGGFVSGIINVSNRPGLDIYAAQGGQSAGNGASGGWGRVNGSDGSSEGAGGGGMAAIAVSGSSEDLMAAGGGSGAIIDGFLSGDSAGAGANSSIGGSAPPDDTNNPGNNGTGIAAAEIINPTILNGSGSRGGTSSGENGLNAEIRLTYDINNYTITESKVTYNSTDYSDLKQQNSVSLKDQLTIRSNITDPDSNLEEAQITIKNPKGTTKLANASMTNISYVSIGGYDGATFEKNYTFSNTNELGDWSYTIWSRDKLDLWNKSSSSFTLVDNTIPDWRNQNQNRSLMTVNNTVELKAEGFDNYNLSFGKLATNETGNWKNKTNNYSSPQTIFSKDSWETTSFDWKNQSIKGNKSVHWRVWYNDTSGNTVATDTQSFRVRENYDFPRNITESIPYKLNNTKRGFSGFRSLSENIAIQSAVNNSLQLGRLDTFSALFKPNSSRSQVIKSQLIESLTTEENSPRTSFGSRSFVTGAAFKNPSARINDVARIFSQSITIDDTALSFYQGLRTQAEEVTLKQISKRTQSLGRRNPLTLTYTESSFRDGIVDRIITDTYSPKTTESRMFTGNRLFTAAIETADVTSRTGFNLRDLNQGVAVTAVSERAFSGSRTILGQLMISDTRSRNIINLRTLSESISYTDKGLTESVLARSFNQIINIQSQETRTAFNFRSVAETFSSEDNSFRTQTVSRIIADVTGFNSNIAAESILDRTFQSMYSLDTTEARGFTGSRVTSQIVTLDPQVVRNSDLFRTDIFTAAFTDQTTQSSSLGRLISEEVLQNTDVLSSSILSRNFEQTARFQSDEVRGTDIKRLVNEGLESSGNSFRSVNSVRNLALGISPGSTVKRSLQSSRTFTQDINYQERLARSFLGSRLLSTEILGSEESVRTVQQNRQESETFSVGNTATRYILNLRNSPVNLVIGNTVTRSTDVVRLFEQSTGVEIVELRNVLNNRQVADGLTSSESIYSRSILSRTEQIKAEFNTDFPTSSVLTRTQETALEIVSLTPRSLDTYRLFSEGIKVDETTTDFRDQLRIFTTTTAFAGADSRLVSNSRSVSETVSSDLVMTRSLEIARRQLETAGFSAITSQDSSLFRDQLEIISSTNQLTSKSALGRIVQESIESQNQQIRITDLGRLTEQVILTQHISQRTTLQSRSEGTSLGYTEISSRLADNLRSQAENVLISENSNRLSLIDRTLINAFSADQTTARNVLNLRLDETVFDLQTVETRFLDSNRAVTGQFSVSQSVNVQSFLNRVQDSEISLDILENRRAIQNRLLNSKILAVEDISITGNLYRSVTESFTAPQNLLTSSSLERTFSEAFLTQGDTESESVLDRVTDQAVAAQLPVNRQTLILRDQGTGIGYSSVSSRLGNLFREQAEDILVSESSKRLSFVERTVIEGFSTDSETVRSILNNRIQQLNLIVLSDGYRTLDAGRTVTGAFLSSTTEESGSALNRVLGSDISALITEERSTDQGRALNTDVAAAENIFTALDLQRVFYQSINSQQTPTRQTLSGRTVTDVFLGGTTVETGSALSRVISETASTAVDISTVSSLYRIEGFRADFGSDIAVLSLLNRITEEDISASAPTVRTVFSDRILSETVNLNEIRTREILNERIQTAEISTSNLQLTESDLGRIFTQTFTGTAASIRSTSSNRIIIESMDLQTETLRQIIQQRIQRTKIISTDTSIGIPNFRRVLTQTVTQNSQLEVRSVLFRALSTNFEGTISPSPSLDLLRITSENFLTGNAVTSNSALNRLNAETLNILETKESSSNLARMLSENVAVSPAATQFVTFNKIVNEDISTGFELLTDSFTRKMVELTLQTETSETRQQNIYWLTDEITGFTDIQSSSSALGRILNSVFQTDGNLDRVTGQNRDIISGLDLSVTGSSTSSVSRIIPETLKTNIELYRSSALERNLQESIGAENQETVVSNLARFTSQQIISDISFREELNLERIFLTETGYIENRYSSSNLNRIEKTIFSIGETIRTQSLLERNLDTGVAATTDLLQEYVKPRSVEEIFSAGDSQSRQLLNLRSLTETFSKDLTSDRSIISGRVISSSFGTEPGVNRELLQQRLVSNTVPYSSNIEFAVDLYRNINEALNLQSEFPAESVIARALETGVSVNVQDTRQFIRRVTKSESLGLNTNIFRQSLNLRTATESIGILTDAERTDFTASRITQQILEMQGFPERETTLIRYFSVKTGITGEDSRILTATRTLGLSPVFNSAIVSDEILQRTLGTDIESGEDVLRNTLSSRVFEQTFGSSVENTQTLLAGRFTETSIGTSTIFDSESALSRLLRTEIQSGNAAQTTLELGRNIGESVIYTSGQTRTLNVYSQVLENIALENQQLVEAKLARILETTTEANTDIDRLSLIERAVIAGISVDTEETGIRSVSRSILETITPNIAEEATSSIKRVLTQDITESANIDTESVLERGFSQSLLTGDATSSGSVIQRIISESLETDQVRDTSLILPRAFGLNIIGQADESAESTVQRSLSDSLLTEESTSSESLLGRLFTGKLSFTEGPETNTFFGRFTDTDLGFGELAERSTGTDRTTTTGLTYSTALTNRNIMNIIIGDEVGLKSVPSYEKTLTRAFVSSVGIQESTFTDFSLLDVVVRTGIGFQDERERQVSVIRQVSENFGLEWIFDSFLPDSDDDTTDDTDSTDDSTDSDSGGGGGGGFGGGGGTTDPVDEVTESPKLSFTGEKVTVKLAPGESSMAQAELENNGNAEAETSLEIVRFNTETVEAINLQSNEYVIEQDSSANPTMEIQVPEYLSNENLSDRVLERSLQASSAESSASLPINILIKSEKEELLDVRLDIAENEIIEGDSVDYSFEIFNLGQTGRVDIELYTTVTNSTGDIVHEQKEELAVQTSASVSRNLDADLPPGNYRIETRAVYAGKDASSFSTLRIEEEEDKTLENVVAALGVIALMAGSALIAILGYKRRETDYDELIEKNISEVKNYAKSHDINFQELLKEEESHKDRKTLEKWAARKAGVDPSRYEDTEQKESSSKTSSSSSGSSSTESTERPVVEIADVKSDKSDKDKHTAQGREDDKQSSQRETKEESETKQKGSEDKSGAAETDHEKKKPEQETERDVESKQSEDTDTETEDKEKKDENEEEDDEDLEKEKRAKEKMEKLQDKLEKIEDINEDLEDTVDED